jgi:dipeptidyl aminopeptidase/acylaminoacyl peptidase
MSPAPKRLGMQPEDVGLLVNVDDPRVAPDGLTVAYVVTTIDLDANEYRSRIWLVPTDGLGEPRPFTSGASRDKTPRWSPDGTRVAFVTHREDSGSQLYVLPVFGGGEPVCLASSPEEIDDLAWSPDGRTIAFGARERDESRYGKTKPKDQAPRRITHLYYRSDGAGYVVDRPRHLFTVPTDGSAKASALTDGAWGDSGLSWSPDGKWIAFASARHDTWDIDRAVDLWRVRADGSAPAEQLTETGFNFGRPSYSPDGDDIAFVGAATGVLPANSQVGVLEVATGDVTILTPSLDRHCLPYLWGAREPAWDGDYVWFTAEDRANQPLYRVHADPVDDDPPGPELMVDGERIVAGFDVRNGVAAFAWANPTTQFELSVLVDGVEKQLTRHGERLLTLRQIQEPEAYTATSKDKTKVPCWVIPPVGAKAGKKYPALLHIHGGPFTQYGNKLFDEFQVAAGAGYAVIYCNPRGSSGYGEGWGRALRGRNAPVEPGTGWGSVDYEDVMAAVDAAVKQFDFVDGDRLGVLGGSYGGYMTSWIVTHNKKFKAAVSERSANNLALMEGNSDIATAFFGYHGKSVVDDRDEYVRQSPTTYLDKITTPLLIMHSEDDLRCPIAQAEELFAGLRWLKRDVEMVRFPGEGHEMSRSGAPLHRKQRFEVILEWFDRYLK